MLQIQMRNNNNNMHSASASVLMGLQTDVQMIKYNRDYSFLLSEDAEVPPPPPPSYSQLRKKFPPKSQATGTAKLPAGRGLTSESRTSAITGHKKDGAPAAARSGESAAVQKSAVASKLHLPVHVSSKSLLRKGETEELSNKTPNPKSAVQSTGVPSRLHPASVSKQPLSRKGDRQEPRTSNAASSLTPKSAEQKPVIPSTLQPPVSKQTLSRKSTAAAEKKPVVSSRLHPPVSKQTLSSKGESQVRKKPTAASSLPPKSAMQRPKGEILQKQQVPRPSSNPKVTQTQPLAKSSVRAREVDDHQPKKRPRSHDDEEKPELDCAIGEIRKMFGYNPKKYVDDYDDDRNMVANFQDIQREEKRSARIAGKEDREELRKIQEEDRRERLQKNAKKRKIENEVRN